MRIDGHSRYRVSRNLAIHPAGPDLFHVGASISSPTYCEVNSSSLLLLSGFATPKTPSEAFADLRGQLQIGRKDFEVGIEAMLANRFLRKVGPQTAEVTGFADLETQRQMLVDRRRVLAYREAIERHAPGKVVVEVGCGTGVLSLLAAKAGAKKVFAIEESTIIELARELAEANGLADRIEFIAGNSMDVDLPDKGDMLIHELFGRDPFEENATFFVADARRRFIKRGGRLLPERVDVFAVGIEHPRSLALSRRGATSRELSKVYGLDFEPLARRLDCETVLRREDTRKRFSQDQVLTKAARLATVDFRAEAPVFSREVAITPTRDGRLGAILVCFEIHLDQRTRLANDLASERTHWTWPLFVLPTPLRARRGRPIHLQAGLELTAGKEHLQLDCRG